VCFRCKLGKFALWEWRSELVERKGCVYKWGYVCYVDVYSCFKLKGPLCAISKNIYMFKQVFSLRKYIVGRKNNSSSTIIVLM